MKRQGLSLGGGTRGKRDEEGFRTWRARFCEGMGIVVAHATVRGRLPPNVVMLGGRAFVLQAGSAPIAEELAYWPATVVEATDVKTRLARRVELLDEVCRWACKMVDPAQLDRDPACRELVQAIEALCEHDGKEKPKW